MSIPEPTLFALQCPDCRRLWVVPWPVTKNRPKPPHEPPYPSPEPCRGHPLRVERPDVVAAYLVGGPDAVWAMSVLYE